MKVNADVDMRDRLEGRALAELMVICVEFDLSKELIRLSWRLQWHSFGADVYSSQPDLVSSDQDRMEERHDQRSAFVGRVELRSSPRG